MEILPWFLTVVPLTITPGPANMTYAASGAAFGCRRTLPLWLGINLICIFQTLVIGAGLGEVLFRYPAVSGTFRYAGAAFMFYLAYKFFKTSRVEKKDIQPLSFIDGVTLELLNFKFLMIPTVLFAQFLSPNHSLWPQILLMTAVLNAINMSGHWVWIKGGDILTAGFTSERAVSIQGCIFGTLLVGVALWMLSN